MPVFGLYLNGPLKCVLHCVWAFQSAIVHKIDLCCWVELQVARCHGVFCPLHSQCIYSIADAYSGSSHLRAMMKTLLGTYQHMYFGDHLPMFPWKWNAEPLIDHRLGDGLKLLPMVVSRACPTSSIWKVYEGFVEGSEA